MQFVALDKLINLHEGYRQVFRIDGREVLLVQENGRRYALQANCPHSDWPMQNAPVSGDVITCTRHGWSFSLLSGRGVNERAIGCQLKCYKVQYDQNTIGILID